MCCIVIYCVLLALCFEAFSTEATTEALQEDLVEAIKLVNKIRKDREINPKYFHIAHTILREKQEIKSDKIMMRRLILQQLLFRDCSQIYERGYRVSGVYSLWLQEGYRYALFYCDMDTVSELTNKRGWTVIQKRFDGSVDFDRKWNEYVKGFGKLKGEHWIGLENIHSLTRQISGITMSLLVKSPRLRIEFEDWDGLEAYIEIEQFAIDGAEDHYGIAIARNAYGPAQYKGSISPPLGARHFSTIDNVNTRQDCPRMRTGGWWFSDTDTCGVSNLNAHRSNQKAFMGFRNIYWHSWPTKYGRRTSLKRVSMKMQF